MRIWARAAAVPLVWMLGCAPLVPAPTAHASDDHETVRALVESGAILPLEAILDNAYGRFPGRLLEADLEREDGALVYELEILTEQGRVLELQYDARDGSLIKVEQED